MLEMLIRRELMRTALLASIIDKRSPHTKTHCPQLIWLWSGDGNNIGEKTRKPPHPSVFALSVCGKFWRLENSTDSSCSQKPPASLMEGCGRELVWGRLSGEKRDYCGKDSQTGGEGSDLNPTQWFSQLFPIQGANKWLFFKKNAEISKGAAFGNFPHIIAFILWERPYSYKDEGKVHKKIQKITNKC